MNALEYAYKSPDLAAHVPTLSALASGKRVCEFGVRTGHSTAAFFHGGPREFVSYDILTPFNIAQLETLARACGVDWKFTEADDLKIEIAPCDVLFIDTVHTGEHLAKELDKHADKVAELIVLHDTAMPFVSDDCDSFTMWQAIGRFLESGEWAIKLHDIRDNGLTILERAK